MSVAENIAKVRSGLPSGVELVAVSKTHPVEAVAEAYVAGQRAFGENRPQEMAAKHSALAASGGSGGFLGFPVPGGSCDSPHFSAQSGFSEGLSAPFADIRWHQIGHLQTNKVKLIAPFVSLIQSADSARLLREINRQATLNSRTIDVLLEIKIAREANKEGWAWAELTEWLEGGEYKDFRGVRFCGVMGVATNTDDEARIRREFATLADYRARLGQRFFAGGFDTVSMGMSSDYEIAAECGSTMVRIGSLIFGARDYPL